MLKTGMHNQNQSEGNRGFTLIELIVSVGVFAIVMTLATGGYLLIISANRQAQATATGVDNLSFALETMSRTIRTGTGYHCGSPSGGDCAGGASAFYVTAPNGTSIGFSRVASASLCGASGIGCLVETQNGGTYPLTSPDVDLSSLIFYVSGSSPTDSLPPHLTITASGSVSSGPGKSVPFTVETGATMRGTDL